ncbi:MAG: hypothetical protein JWO36_778 [Myxococcales bacterium]|nr:hypothetical protein [Myxococcales bacterium]
MISRMPEMERSQRTVGSGVALRRIALIAGSALLASFASAHAAPDGSGSGSGDDIEMEPDTVGSGSATTSPAKPPAAKPPATPPAPKPPTPAASDTPAPDAGSDQPVKDPKVAKKWIAAAQQLVQKGDYLTRAKAPDAKAQYENAITAYQKAIEAGDDSAPTYFALALTEDKIGHEADAYKHLKIVIDPKAAAKPDVVKKAQAKLEEISMKVGTVTLTVKPEGTQIQIAGKDVGESPLTEPLILDPGTYTLSFIAVGYQPKDAELKVEAGSESERKIELEPVKVVVRSHEEVEPTEAVAKPPSKLPLYVGAGATGGFVVIAVVTGILAVGQHSTFTGSNTQGLDRLDAQSNGKTYAHVTDGLLVGAVVAAGFTAYWYQYKYRPAAKAYAAEKHPATAKVHVVPWVQPDASGFTLAGAF